MIELIEETHEYIVDGIHYDGVTSIIREAGLMPSYSPQDLSWYLQRGTYIHRATELYDKGDLDEATLDPEIKGYVESYKKLGLKYTPDEIELRLADKIYQVAGTLDRPDYDIKSGSYAAWHVVQAGIYWHLKKVNGLDNKPINACYFKQGSF